MGRPLQCRVCPWAAQARAPRKMEWTLHQPQSREHPYAFLLRPRLHMLPVTHGEVGIWAPGNHEEWHMEDQGRGGPGLRVFPSQGRRPHLSIMRVAWSGPRYPGYIFRLVPQWAVASACPTLPDTLSRSCVTWLAAHCRGQPAFPQGHQPPAAGFLLPQLGTWPPPSYVPRGRGTRRP